MKTMKKLASMLMAVIMMLSLTVTAFAAGPTGSITIENSKTVSVAGKTFAAYKVMDATFVDVNDVSKGVAYTVPAELEDFYAARYELDKTAAAFDQDVTAKIAVEKDMNAFAKDVLAAAKAAKINPTRATAGEAAENVKIANLALGYYVIEDEGAKTPISALVLDTTTKDATVTIKADKPAIDKKIDGDKDTDPSTNGEVEMNNAAIGDKVPYILTSKVPDMTGYTKYFYIVHDTLSKGLTFNNDVEITVGGQTLSKDTDYTVSQTTLDNGETAVKIVFKDFYNKYKDNAGADIVIKYSATIDTDAVIGVEGNPNKVNLEYSHNPNLTPEGVDEPTPGDKENGVTGTTPNEITKTFVTGIKIIKVDEKGNKLEGAEFELKGERLNTVLVKKDVFTESPDGTYYKLKDGTYTKEAPSGNDDLYESTTTKYKLETKTEVIEKAQEVQYKGTVGHDGVLRFDGLAAGKYEITELKAPDGYNLIKTPIKVTIICNLPENGEGNCTWEVTEPGQVVDGIIELKVVNKTGAELPSTGGMGTTMFYVIGGILVALAAVLMIVRKRMSLER